MKKIILAVAFAAGAPFSAFAAESCDATYLSNHGDSLKSIVDRAYAAPMLKIVQARNPHIDSVAKQLNSGVEVYLPCIHSLPQFSPQLSELNGQQTVTAALR